jgi:hypothetical protein
MSQTRRKYDRDRRDKVSTVKVAGNESPKLIFRMTTQKSINAKCEEKRRK